MRMFARRLQSHKVHDVDDADFDVREMVAEKINGGESFERRDVSSAGQNDIWLSTLIGAGPIPDADTGRAMLDGSVHVEILERGLFAGDDDVDVIAAAKAMIGDGEETVGVGRKIDADDVSFLVDDVVYEARILMREAVVVLTPNMRCEEIVERCDGRRHGMPRVTFSHFAC